MIGSRSVFYRPSLLARMFSQAIAIVVCVIIPIVITLLVPISALEIVKSGSNIQVSIMRYVLMYIPWQSLSIADVRSFRADVTADRRRKGTIEERRRGVKGTEFGTGQITIISDGPEVIVQAAPDLAKSITAKFNEFADERSPEPLRFVYASWWLSYVLGGVITFLCALYGVGAALAVGSFVLKLGGARQS